MANSVAAMDFTGFKWDECVKQDLKVCGLSEAGTQDRVSWRSSVKNSRQEPTPSNGSTPHRHRHRHVLFNIQVQLHKKNNK